MNKIKIDLKNCYGIPSLETEFDFSRGRTFIIYAPNGVMKTSFAKTAKVLYENGDEKPHDQVNTDLVSRYDFFSDENEFNPSNFCVIEPYNESAFHSEDNILLLLGSEEDRKEYTAIWKELETQKKNSFSGMQKNSGSKNFENEIIETFSYLNNDSIYEILCEILDNIKESKDEYNFPYNDVFDSSGKVRDFLKENGELLEQYFSKYRELLKKSDFFTENENTTFGTTEAKILSKGIKDGGSYFDVGYGLYLSEEDIILDQQKLDERISGEVEKILANTELQAIFKKVDDALDKHNNLKKFKKALDKNPEILVELKDYDNFRRKVWFSFLKKQEQGFVALVDLYTDKKARLEEIIDESKNIQTEWQSAIDEFENRFIDMPFKMDIKNKPDVILQQKRPTLEFSFRGKTLPREDLVNKVLSQGEKRAFYILNVLFEIKKRKKSDNETLFIVDDIADSFDYKNKYAIVEYLNDLQKEEKFYSLIFTHNFDFYRTITGRLGIVRENKLHAIKDGKKIDLLQEVYQKPPFKTWKECLEPCNYGNKQHDSAACRKYIISLIPFVRNIVEYVHDKKVNSVEGVDSDYELLTMLLHKKIKTEDINFEHLKIIYKEYLGKDNFDSSDSSLIGNDQSVYESLLDCAESIAGDEFNLEDKIVLAMAIRLKAENYMLSKIQNSEKHSIAGSQTRELFNMYVTEYFQDESHKKTIDLLEKVNIITPENIHLNSFMYEPILDMGVNELKQLFGDVSKL